MGVVAADQAQNGDGVDFANETVGTLLALGGEVAVAQVVTVEAKWSPLLGGSKTEGERRERRFMFAALGASPVEASMEFL